MKKFRFLLVVAIVLVSALALCLTAGATETATAETYEQLYVGEYTSEETPSQEGVSYTGEAYIVFGKVTGSEQAGIILERYAEDDSDYSNVLETKYFGAREGRVAANGEFGIALYNVAKGYYKAKVIAGDYKNPTAEGAYTTFSAGVGTFTVDFLIDADRLESYEVVAGGTVVPPVVEREGYELMGWTYNIVKSDGTNPNLIAGHREVYSAATLESNPASFSNITSDRIYVAQWTWVGESGDSKAPTNMSLDMSGYSKLSVKRSITDDQIEIPAGSVAVMSFDVLENAAVSGPTMISLLSTGTSYYAYQAFHAEDTFSPLCKEGVWSENTGEFYATMIETGNLMTPEAVLKAGKSVKLVYKPYEAATGTTEAIPGYYHAYVKDTGSEGDYTLFAGWENMEANVATSHQMPAFITGMTAGWWEGGSLSTALRNLQIGIDADGDYTTTEDFTDMGIGVAENHENISSSASTLVPITSRFVNIRNYVPVREYEYTFTDGGVQAYNCNTVFVGASTVNRENYSVDEDEKLTIAFTVIDSNIAEITQSTDHRRVSMGFGLANTPNGAWNDFTGIHGHGLMVGLEDGEDAIATALAGSTQNTWYNECDTIVANSEGVGMRTLLKPGTKVEVDIALDLSDDGSNTGYIKIWYMTTEMDDWALAASMTGVGNQVALSAHAYVANAYPLVYMTSGYATDARLNLTIGNFSATTYDADGNVTSEVIQLATVGAAQNNNGGTTVVSNLD